MDFSVINLSTNSASISPLQNTFGFLGNAPFSQSFESFFSSELFASNFRAQSSLRLMENFFSELIPASRNFFAPAAYSSGKECLPLDKWDGIQTRIVFDLSYLHSSDFQELVSTEKRKDALSRMTAVFSDFFSFTESETAAGSRPVQFSPNETAPRFFGLSCADNSPQVSGQLASTWKARGNAEANRFPYEKPSPNGEKKPSNSASDSVLKRVLDRCLTFVRQILRQRS